MIAIRQQSDPDVWKDLTAMVELLRKFQVSQSNTQGYRPPSTEQIRNFLAEEQTEVS